jgi:N-acetylglutamate synthase-like GNAT family acetyltransferase
MEIRKATTEELDRCIEIARNLSDWFDETDMIGVEKSIKSLPTYVYSDNGIAGFISIKEKSDNVIEIDTLAVDLERHHQGIGTELLKFTEDKLATGRIIEVKTLDSSSDYKPYALTRAFYEKNGFVKVEVVSPYPGWSPDCPCAIYVKP